MSNQVSKNVKPSGALQLIAEEWRVVAYGFGGGEAPSF